MKNYNVGVVVGRFQLDMPHAQQENLLTEVFRNGKLLVDQTFNQVRENAKI